MGLWVERWEGLFVSEGGSSRLGIPEAVLNA